MKERIVRIDKNRELMEQIHIPDLEKELLRKEARKRSSYASNKIEGNPLDENQAFLAMNQGSRHHFSKPEKDMRNYKEALEYLDRQRGKKKPLPADLIVRVQSIVEKGEPDKTGLRQPMPPGVLFAVYDSKTGKADYIPPEASDIPVLLEELIRYVQTTKDHPLIAAGIVHYQLVTIHPFEDGNGRTARLISGYLLNYSGYAFQGIGSLEEVFLETLDEYYRSLQMGLPALYYQGRNDPPHPEIWLDFFLNSVEQYSANVLAMAQEAVSDHF